MTAQKASGIGLAMDGSVMVMTWHDPDRKGTLQSATTQCDATPERIVAAMAELARRAPIASRIVVTLCRPLAQSRIVALPRMSRAIIESIIARDWARHVIGIRPTPHDAAARQLARDRWSAAFAPSDVLEALTAGAENQGWHDIELRTSDDALAGIVRAHAPSSRAVTPQFVVVCDERAPTDAVYVRNGDAHIGRRFPREATDNDVIAFIDAGDAESVAQGQHNITVLGDASRATTLVRALTARGHRAQVADLGLPGGSTALTHIAAAGLLHPARLLLTTATTRARVANALRRLTWQLAFATAAALVAAFLLARWDVSRTLTHVRQQRADISGEVRRALATRAQMEGAADIATVLAEREEHASRSSAAAAAVAVALPRTASLTVLSIVGDSLLIEGESPQSAEVYGALRQVAALEKIQAAAPLRQERQADAVVERFAFSARLRALPRVMGGAR
ncbi:MAG: hypothetical protein ABJE10_00270 [bacterium]